VIIDIEDIAHYASCPQYYKFWTQNRPFLWKPTTQIVIDAVKKAYLVAADTGYRAEWRRILGWVNRMAFDGVDVDDECEFKAARSVSEGALLALQGWYDTMYRTENLFAQIDVDVGCSVDNDDVIVRATIPIVKLDEIPTVMRFTDFVSSKPRIYNDIATRGIAAMLADGCKCDTVRVQHMAIGPRGRLEYEEVQINREAHERALTAIAKIAVLIKAGMVYPSVTDMCTNCTFKKECVL